MTNITPAERAKFAAWCGTQARGCEERANRCLEINESVANGYKARVVALETVIADVHPEPIKLNDIKPLTAADFGKCINFCNDMAARMERAGDMAQAIGTDSGMIISHADQSLAAAYHIVRSLLVTASENTPKAKRPRKMTGKPEGTAGQGK